MVAVAAVTPLSGRLLQRRQRVLRPQRHAAQRRHVEQAVVAQARAVASAVPLQAEGKEAVRRAAQLPAAVAAEAEAVHRSRRSTKRCERQLPQHRNLKTTAPRIVCHRECRASWVNLTRWNS